VSEKKYLILAEALSHDPHYAKTASGVIRYRRESVVAILDSKRAGESDDGIPIVATVEDALRHEPNTALVGVATQGGVFPGDWQQLLKTCVEKGLNLENGLHVRLHDIPELTELAVEHGVELTDLREPPSNLSTATGDNLDVNATIVLSVGSDCAIGKMTATCELDLEARRRGLRSVFVPTGQTGIAIAGWGISVDAVVSDFLAGAAERLVVEGARRGDLLWIEGQGAILHPIYSGVTVGLMHGSAPHLYVLCHEVGRDVVEGDPTESPIPSLSELVDLHERLSLKRRPARVACIALNTSKVSEDDAREAIAAAEEETGLPADDPVRFGAGKLLDAVLQGADLGGAA
jgi:uncharacterized NAD-dependent epimerase/dehydratase family protein